MDIIAMLLAWSGAFLTALKTNRQRFWGFVCYFTANITWIIWAFSQETIMITIAGQAIGFIIPSILGLVNNSKSE